MVFSARKAVRFPAVLVLSAGIGLGGVATAPAFADPGPGYAVTALAVPPPDAPGPSDRAKKLGRALITEKDLPGGFEKQPDEYLVEMFRSMLGRHRPDADPCAVPGKPVDVPVRPEGPPSAATLFFNEKKGLVAVETLAVLGADTAAGMVTSLGVALEKCPDVKAEGVTLTMRPLDWDPPLGDRSRTVGMVMEMDIDGVKVTMRGKLAQVAYRDVSLVVGLIGSTEPADRHLKKIATAAVRKLVESPDVFTTEKPQKP
jgi:hypothetical protein